MYDKTSRGWLAIGITGAMINIANSAVKRANFANNVFTYGVPPFKCDTSTRINCHGDIFQTPRRAYTRASADDEISRSL